MSTATDPAQTVRSIYAAFERGDIPAVFERLDPEVEIRQSEEMPWGGVYRGCEGAAAFFGALAEHIDTKVEIDRLIVAGDAVVETGRTRGRVRGQPRDARRARSRLSAALALQSRSPNRVRARNRGRAPDIDDSGASGAARARGPPPGRPAAPLSPDAPAACALSARLVALLGAQRREHLLLVCHDEQGAGEGRGGEAEGRTRGLSVKSTSPCPRSSPYWDAQASSRRPITISTRPTTAITSESKSGRSDAHWATSSSSRSRSVTRPRTA